jgi:serine phosphatase RsbU (regulator of sigma subunit)
LAKATKPTAHAVGLRERWRHARIRIGDPLRWDDIDKVLVVLALQVPAAAILFVRSAALLHNPALEPYLDRGVMRWASALLGGFLVFVAVAVIVGLRLRNWDRGRRRYLTSVVVVWWVTAAMGVYLHGPATSPVLVLFPLIALTSLLLFDPRIATAGFAVGIALIAFTTLGERAGLLPYAPIFATFPVVDGRIADTWLYSTLTWTTLGSVGVFSVFARVLRRERRQAAELATLSTQLRSELRQAADYVSSLLPRPIRGERGLTVEWSFVPSAELGGDAFTVLWLDEEHFAIALLDVSGHGVGAALHGVSAIHALRGQRMGSANPRDPSAVLAALNQEFDMDEHSGLFFTAWYGVFERTSRRLRYASGGHPPAVLRTGETRGEAKPVLLATGGPLVGVIPGACFETREIELGPFAELFVFSDGIFEVALPSGEQLDWREFIETLTSLASQARADVVDALVGEIRRRSGRAFEDDVSVLRVEFQASVDASELDSLPTIP